MQRARNMMRGNSAGKVDEPPNDCESVQYSVTVLSSLLGKRQPLSRQVPDSDQLVAQFSLDDLRSGVPNHDDASKASRSRSIRTASSKATTPSSSSGRSTKRQKSVASSQGSRKPPVRPSSKMVPQKRMLSKFTRPVNAELPGSSTRTSSSRGSLGKNARNSEDHESAIISRASSRSEQLEVASSNIGSLRSGSTAEDKLDPTQRRRLLISKARTVLGIQTNKHQNTDGSDEGSLKGRDRSSPIQTDVESSPGSQSDSRVLRAKGTQDSVSFKADAPPLTPSNLSKAHSVESLFDEITCVTESVNDNRGKNQSGMEDGHDEGSKVSMITSSTGNESKTSSKNRKFSHRRSLSSHSGGSVSLGSRILGWTKSNSKKESASTTIEETNLPVSKAKDPEPEEPEPEKEELEPEENPLYDVQMQRPPSPLRPILLVTETSALSITEKADNLNNPIRYKKSQAQTEGLKNKNSLPVARENSYGPYSFLNCVQMNDLEDAVFSGPGEWLPLGRCSTVKVLPTINSGDTDDADWYDGNDTVGSWTGKRDAQSSRLSTSMDDATLADESTVGGHHGNGTTIWTACRTGNESFVQKLLIKEPYIVRAMQNGRTPLFYAAISGHDRIVKLLLNAGAQDTDQKIYRLELLNDKVRELLRAHHEERSIIGDHPESDRHGVQASGSIIQRPAWMQNRNTSAVVRKDEDDEFSTDDTYANQARDSTFTEDEDSSSDGTSSVGILSVLESFGLKLPRWRGDASETSNSTVTKTSNDPSKSAAVGDSVAGENEEKYGDDDASRSFVTRQSDADFNPSEVGSYNRFSAVGTNQPSAHEFLAMTSSCAQSNAMEKSMATEASSGFLGNAGNFNDPNRPEGVDTWLSLSSSQNKPAEEYRVRQAGFEVVLDNFEGFSQKIPEEKDDEAVAVDEEEDLDESIETEGVEKELTPEKEIRRKGILGNATNRTRKTVRFRLGTKGSQSDSSLEDKSQVSSLKDFASVASQVISSEKLLRSTSDPDKHVEIENLQSLGVIKTRSTQAEKEKARRLAIIKPPMFRRIPTPHPHPDVTPHLDQDPASEVTTGKTNQENSVLSAKTSVTEEEDSRYETSFNVSTVSEFSGDSRDKPENDLIDAASDAVTDGPNVIRDLSREVLFLCGCNNPHYIPKDD